MTKQFLLLVAISLLLPACQRLNITPATTSKPVNRLPIDLTNKRVLFLGNSITHNGLYVSLIEYALRKNNPTDTIDIISIGLGSETISCLSEPKHPYPRPCVLERLDQALAAIQPAVIVSCYGMNDGIYHPPAMDRLEAYQKGTHQLIQKAKKINAELILLTPTPFDELPIQQKTVGLEASLFGYSTPYEGYDEVLGEYAAWLNTLDGKGVRVVDWHTKVNQEVATKRVRNPTFTYAKDGVHPNEAGHLLMAQIFLKGLQKTSANRYLPDYQSIQADPFFQETHENRVNRSQRWLNYIGYSRGKTVKSISPKSLLMLMGGQSNMTGLGLKSELPSTELPKNIRFIDYGLNGKKEVMADQFGPEYGMAEQLTEAFPDQHFTLLKYSIGGASLLDWAPDYNKEKASITGNAQFGNVYAQFFQKIDSLLASQSEIEPTAILWMQGERDARIPEAGKDYYQNLKKLIVTCRERLGQANLPFLFGMVNPPAERYAAVETVRQAQKKIAKEVAHVYIIETDDLAKLKDNLHYNAAGQLEMGKRFGKQLTELIVQKSW